MSAAYKLKPDVDTTEIMSTFRAHMSAVKLEQDDQVIRCSHGGYVKRTIDRSLLDFDAMREKMLPFCEQPNGQSTRRLAKLSIMFMQTPHFKRAVELGWSAVDFFGVPARDVRDAKPRGLLPTLAWSRFNGKVRGIDQEGVKVVIPHASGIPSVQMWRPHPMPMTVPFWESSGLEVMQ